MARVNFLIDDLVWKDLEEIPRGERSRFVNKALRESLLKKQRQDASEKLDELRRRGPSVGTEEIVELLRRDRDRTK